MLSRMRNSGKLVKFGVIFALPLNIHGALVFNAALITEVGDCGDGKSRRGYGGKCL